MIAIVQDLNRVINKPYAENKDDTSGLPDEVTTSILLASYQTVYLLWSKRNWLLAKFTFSKFFGQNLNNSLR